MFKFNGKSTDDFSIIVEEELNLLKRASQRYNETSIPGKNGSDYEEQGYSNVEISLKLQLLDINRLSEIFSWLNGEGILEYNEKETKARIYAEEEPIRFGRIYTIDITIIRDAFWYPKNDSYKQITDSIENAGNVYSSPILRLEKTTSQSVEVTINNVRFKYDFENDDFVEFDCDSCDATMNGLNRNQNIEIGFEMPILNPGINNVIKNFGDCNIKVKRKDRFL